MNFFKKFLTFNIAICLVLVFSLTAFAGDVNHGIDSNTGVIVLDVTYEELYYMVDELNDKLNNDYIGIDTFFRPGNVGIFSAPTPWAGHRNGRSSEDFDLQANVRYAVHAFYFNENTHQVVPNPSFSFTIMQRNALWDEVVISSIGPCWSFSLSRLVNTRLYLANPVNAAGNYQLVVFRPI